MKCSAGVVVFRDRDNCPLFLILRAYRNWDFPKGEIEAGESPLEAAMRETKEETAIEDLHFPFGAVFFEIGPYGKGKIARYYLGETRKAHVTLPVNPELGRPEHHEWRWVSLEEARKLLPERLLPVLDWAAHFFTDQVA